MRAKQKLERDWAHISAKVEARLGAARSMRWLPRLYARSFAGSTLCLHAATESAARLAQKYRAVVGEVASELLGAEVSVEVSTGPVAATKNTPKRDAARRARPSAPVKAPPSTAGKAPRPTKGSGRSRRSNLNARHRLASFVPGGANELALRFAHEVVAAPGRHYNPFVVHGGEVVGKTHLIQGVALAFRERFKRKRLGCLSVESFANEFGLALQRGTLTRFRSKYRSLHLLVLDDLQLLGTKRFVQQEVLHLLDLLFQRGAQVVLAGDRSPREVTGLCPALRTRLMSGLCVELKKGDLAQRRSIIEGQARQLGVELAPEVLSCIAERSPTDTRELIGVMTKLSAYASLTGRVLDEATALRVLSEIVTEQLEHASPETLKNMVAQRFGLNAKQLGGGSRKPKAVKARHLAMTLTRELTGLTAREVGAAFGGRSSSSVHFAARRWAEICSKDPELEALTEEIRGSFVSARDRGR
jgi:chromosomal replication initiator protein